MGPGEFSGKFAKTVEAFTVQSLDPTDLNRLASDALFWLVVLTGAFLAVHFVFSALPGLKGARSEEGSMKDAQFKRRDAAKILYHWVNFAAIAALITTGLLMFFGDPDTAGLFTWHLWAAWIFLAALAFHIWYDTIRFKHFHRMWATLGDLGDAMKRMPGAGGAGAEPAPKHGFYKVEQIVYHWILAAVVLGLVITGFILWNPSRIYVAAFWMPWGWDGIFVARVLHDIFTFLLVAMIVAHIYFAVAVPKNWYVLKSIFTGLVPLSSYVKQHRGSPEFESRVKDLEGGREQGTPMTGAEGVRSD